MCDEGDKMGQFDKFMTKYAKWTFQAFVNMCLLMAILYSIAVIK